jgi:hypothetical protein
MPPKKRGRKGDSDANKKAKVELTPEEIELLKQTADMFNHFFRDSFNWVGGDDDLEFDRELPLVHGKSFYDVDNDVEVLVVSRVDGKNFTATFQKKLRPFMIEVVNQIVKDHNAWLESSNFRIDHLDQSEVEGFLDVKLNPKVESSCHRASEEEQGVRRGCLGIYRRSGTSENHRWDSSVPMDSWEIEHFAKMPCGNKEPLLLIE